MKEIVSAQAAQQTGWIGVDLDGTLAEYHGWKGPEHIGAPIPAMVDRVREWLSAGKRVKIFTARTPFDSKVIGPIQFWCQANIGAVLPVTNVKEQGMIEFWDDRAERAPKNGACTPAEMLEEMARTYRERNEIYGDNFRLVGPVMMAMFPKGIELRTAQDFERWHLFELLVVKLTRFATSGLEHQDSIHDAGVYSAMIESIIKERDSDK